MKTYFLTGAMGFVGSHWAKNLLKSGNKVIGIDTKLTSPELLEYEFLQFHPHGH